MIKRKGVFVSAGNAIGKVLGRLGLDESAGIYRMSKAWKEITSTAAAEHSCPDQVKSGCLYVAVDNPVWTTELGFMKAEMISRLSEKYRDLGIKDIRFTVKKFRFSR